MRYAVGYPGIKNEKFIERIIDRKEFVYEVYFAFGDIPNGRSPQNSADSCEMPWESLLRQTNDLKRFTDAGIGLNLLLNANCYGEEALSRAFFMKIGDTLEWLASRFSIGSVTTASPYIGKFVHSNFTGIDVRASVNIGIGSPQAMDYVAEYYDSYYIKRELNRDFEKIREIRAWCDVNGKGLFMLANSGCLNECSAHTFHDNLVAHENGISKLDNAYSFTSVCRDYLKNPQKRVSLISDMNYVRPEDIHLYEGLFTAAKLATRVNKCPERILDAYLAKHYTGAITDLLEPDNGSSILPELIDNSLFPSDFGEHVSNCKRKCADCTYCCDVLKKSTVYLG